MIPAWVTVKDKGENVLYLNSLLRYIKGGFQSAAAGSLPIVIAAAPAAGIPSLAPPIILEGCIDGITEIFSIMGQHNPGVAADVQNRMTVLITDNSFRRRLSNREVLVNHVFGDSFQPFFLRETIMLEPQQTLSFEFANNSMAGPTSYEFLAERRKFQATVLSRDQVTGFIKDSKQRKLFLNPYWFTSDQPITIPAGGMVNAFFTSSRDSYLTHMSTIATFISAGIAGDLVEGFAVRIFDAKTERPLQNQPVVRSCCSGTPQFPFQLPTALIQEPNTKMRMELTNLITDAPTEVFWSWQSVVNWTARNPMEVQPGVALPAPSAVGA